MKWYKVCNRISLLLHALCSALGYFLIRDDQPPSFSAAWTYMTTKPLVFAYNAALIFTTSLIVYLFRRRCFWQSSDLDLVAVAWYYQWSDPVQQGYSVYRTGSSSSDRRNGSHE